MCLIQVCGNTVYKPEEERTEAVTTSAKGVCYKSIYNIIENSVLNSTFRHARVQVFKKVKQPSKPGG